MLAFKRECLRVRTFRYLSNVPPVLPRDKFRWRYSGYRIDTRQGSHQTPKSTRQWLVVPATLVLFSGAGYLTYQHYQPFRHLVLAAARCSRVAGDPFPLFDIRGVSHTLYDRRGITRCHRL